MLYILFLLLRVPHSRSRHAGPPLICLALPWRSLAAWPACRASACAEPWPQRPIRTIVPFAAGGSSDLAARIVARYIGEPLAQQVVVENRPGASGVLAAEVVARAPADGYTLLMATTAQVSIMPRIARTSYDPRKDLAPVGVVATNPFVLAVHPSLPVRTVGELVAFARGAAARPSPMRPPGRAASATCRWSCFSIAPGCA